MMKSIYIKVLLLLFLALTIACRKEMDPPSSAPEVQTVHYKATVQAGVDTRATLGDGLKYVFETEDRIYMESEDGNLYGFLSLSSDDGIGKNTALFEGDLNYVGEEPFQNSNPSVSLVLVSQNDALHTIASTGKLEPVASGSYRSDQCASSLEDAVSRLSHFTGTGNFNDMRFTLQQQSSFLKCFVRMSLEQAPENKTMSVKLLNNNNVPLRAASITVSTAGSVPFVFAFPGGEVSLEQAKLRLEWNEPGLGDQSKVFDVADKTLAANKYYSVSRTTLAFDGFRIRSATSNSTTITFNDNYKNDIEYSPDFGEHWYSYAEPLTLDKDAVVCIKGNRENYMNNSGDEWGTPGANPIFTATSPCYISGNIMSLLKDEQLGESAFQGAFSKGKTALTNIDIDPDAPLILPVTTLARQCYMQMFRNCTSLTRAPQFTVEGTAYRCCYNMFRDCTNLVDVSGIELPAMTLSQDCYRELFRSCEKITTSPDLPALNLEQGCYQQMFSNCYQLGYIKCLTTTNVNVKNGNEYKYTNNWMSNAGSNASSKYFYKNSDNNYWMQNNASGIPSGWNVVP